MSGNTDLRDSSASVVLLGNFNPLIFQPHWLAANDVIGAQDAEIATRDGVEILHSQITIINFAAFRLEVSTDRFSIRAIEEPSVLARDFAVKVFKLLSHTPVKQLGINRSVIFRARSRHDWDALGDKLAPKAPWGRLLQEDEEGRVGGLLNLTMERGKRADGRKGMVRVKVTALLPHENLDTQVDVNDHYDVSDRDEDARAEVAVELLEECWENSLAYADNIIDELRGHCRAE